MTGNSQANIWGPRGDLEAGAASANAVWWALEKPQSDYCGWTSMREGRVGRDEAGEAWPGKTW